VALENVELSEIRARIKALRDSGHGLPEIALMVNRPSAFVWAVISEDRGEDDRTVG